HPRGSSSAQRAVHPLHGGTSPAKCAGARRSVLLTTLLGVLDGNNAGSRKLPRQFWLGLEIPNIIDVSGRRRRGDDSRFSWCRVGRRPVTILARDRRCDRPVAMTRWRPFRTPK